MGPRTPGHAARPGGRDVDIPGRRRRPLGTRQAAEPSFIGNAGENRIIGLTLSTTPAQQVTYAASG